MCSLDDGGRVDGAAAVVRRADLVEVAKNTRGGARTFGLLSNKVVLALFGLAFSSVFSVSRRWRRPKGAPVGGGWLVKRLIVVFIEIATSSCGGWYECGDRLARSGQRVRLKVQDSRK